MSTPAGAVMHGSLTHITLNTAATRGIGREHASLSVLLALQEWIARHLNTGKYHPLPTPALAGYVCRLTTRGNGLLATVAVGRPPKPEDPPGLPLLVPLFSFGVAPAASAGTHLWPLLVESFRRENPGEALSPPQVYPWCTVVLHHWLAELDGDADWMGDFQCCVALAWLRLQPA